jgi:glucosamine-6-phosphate deaminase
VSESSPLRTFEVGLLSVEIHDTEEDLGRAAAHFVAAELRRAVAGREEANLVLATGTSQFTFLDALKRDATIRWDRLNVFHLDEYRGISAQHPASFRRYLRERILDDVKPGQVHFLKGDAPDPEEEARRYENLLKAHPIDIACIGIGENGHIAFNDPPVADFNDSRLVKVVRLDEQCRRQQLDEGWFASLEEVPTHALTLTIPAIMSSRHVSCVVPEQRKARAVADALEGPISTTCPASVLRRHPSARLFLDRSAASLIRD